MKRYLIVANQTAAAPYLVNRVTSLKNEEAEARFVLLVPATPVTHLGTWEGHETEEAARKRGEEARAAFADASIDLEDVLVGDRHPVLAIEDELRAHPEGYYDAVILSTLAPGVSRWLALDAQSTAQRRLTIPLLHVYEGGEVRWGPREHGPGVVARVFEFLAGPLPAGSAHRHLLDRGVIIVLALMAIYLVGSATLAIAVDRRFFVNDAIAVLVFALLLAGVVLFERRERSRPRTSG